MNFTGSLRKLRGKASSREDDAQERPRARQSSPNTRTLQFDLFAQLSYMSAVATAGVTRAALFQYAAQLPYSSSGYFRNIHTLAKKLNIDYAQACRMVAEKTREPDVRSLLLRLSGSLASGEGEGEFLRREAEIIGETYGNQYERDVESLKKWTDAYVTLIVASGLIVIVAIISMMIYDVGKAFVLGLGFAMVLAACFGAWVIYASAPREIKTRASGPSSRLQLQALKTFRLALPICVTVCAVMFMLKLPLGIVMLVGAAFLFVPGYLISKDDKRIRQVDSDIPAVVRVLGGVTSAVGTTVTEALGKVDRRSMGSLMPEMTRLRHRLRAGIAPDLCWKALVNETGSELIERTVKMFWDALSLGGDPAKIGNAASFFASRIAFLRASRAMVASTFRWLVLPLHAAMVGLLLFIVEIIGLFSMKITESSAALQDASNLELSSSGLAISDMFAFGNIDMQLVNFMVTAVVFVLTGANAYAPKAADGGHNLKLVFNLAIMMAVSGLLMLLVPVFAHSIFASIVEGAN